MYCHYWHPAPGVGKVWPAGQIMQARWIPLSGSHYFQYSLFVDCQVKWNFRMLSEWKWGSKGQEPFLIRPRSKKYVQPWPTPLTWGWTILRFLQMIVYFFNRLQIFKFNPFYNTKRYLVSNWCRRNSSQDHFWRLFLMFEWRWNSSKIFVRNSE